MIRHWMPRFFAGFNGAALFQARRSAPGILARMPDPLLQRGRAFPSAEIRCNTADTCSAVPLLQRGRAFPSAEMRKI